MGRRKIEIKPIRDDRNRSVTFLKRKGGLFKKAHELSVLCQVDVAVIIFGHNKKLYEYSSSDINETIGRFQYYGAAHEHKGPQDFADKGGGDDDDDDDDMGDDGDGRGPTPQPDPQQQHHLTAGMQHHPSFQHIRHATPQHSPPMPNGPMPPYQRGPSPLPQNLSRPSSRNEPHQAHIRRTSANLLPPQHPHQPPMQPGYAYPPNQQPYYNAQPGAPMHRPPPGPMPQGSTYPPPQYQPQGHPQIQQVMLQGDRRSSMPSFPPQAPPANMRQDLHTPPQQQPHPSPRPQQQQRPTPSPQPPQQQHLSPQPPQPRPLPAHAKSQSMFTPIDDSRSMLAQHWGSTSNAEPPRSDPAKAEPRAASVDMGAVQREVDAKSNGTSSPARRPQRSPQPPQRASSATSAPGQDAKRPRLKVQIPSEQEDDESPSTSQQKDATATDKPAHGVVLPPPSPSASALLSAGAQGPPNPFARPAPPVPNQLRDETPISALPSRFMSENLLPSPSTFYPEWGFGRSATGDSNMLPSPLNFQTPVVGNGGWRDQERREQEEREKRKNSSDGKEDDSKRVKS